jgi:hypothetical protein
MINEDDQIVFPTLLDLPDKLACLIDPDVFNAYDVFIIDGGRGSAKTQSVGRVILYICEKNKVRCIGARELQTSIEDSVYTVLTDLIVRNELNFETPKTRLRHRESDSTIGFKGLREQGIVSVKGLEGVDIVWVDEAQTLTKLSLDTLMPTIRKNNAKIFFTMNRFVREDAVMALVGGKRVLHIHIDYFENKHCPQRLIDQANDCKKKSMKDYNHIWLGQPLDQAEDFLFNFSKLADCRTIEAIGDLPVGASVLAIDFASGGGDLCVASELKRMSMTHWELKDQIAWDDPDTNASVGRSIALYGQKRPDLFLVDKGGLGYPMFMAISLAVPNVIGFDGSETDMCSPNAGNHRAEGYLLFNEWVNNGWIRITSDLTIKQCETIRKKYKANGKIFMKSKEEQRKDGVESQDRADSVMQAIFGIVKFLGKVTYSDKPIGMRIQRTNSRKAI